MWQTHKSQEKFQFQVDLFGPDDCLVEDYFCWNAGSSHAWGAQASWPGQAGTGQNCSTVDSQNSGQVGYNEFWGEK